MAPCSEEKDEQFRRPFLAHMQPPLNPASARRPRHVGSGRYRGQNDLHETLRNDAMAKTPSQTAFIGPRIEPLLMVLLGFDVGGLILAMYLPIFAMGDLFHS